MNDLARHVANLGRSEERARVGERKSAKVTKDREGKFFEQKTAKVAKVFLDSAGGYLIAEEILRPEGVRL
jgi:hypothetical protein